MIPSLVFFLENYTLPSPGYNPGATPLESVPSLRKVHLNLVDTYPPILWRQMP